MFMFSIYNNEGSQKFPFIAMNLEKR
ncbi:hypothetical protein NPIRD3C_1400 [Nitrosopumilus piranensis]|uniref:Uncharacterized protein n=1 Tax=Nitrosopumilus piranensis TaxID=1582439 RepID=A0A0C5CBQ9_9ARCH|nr:hypothetical protein NPIRD3C_1400 [Nitrosopumilus piranensis]